VTSVRVFYKDGQEIEFGLAPLDWAEITYGEIIPSAVKNSVKILLDKKNALFKFGKIIEQNGVRRHSSD
jgi:hypothetical protein